MNALSVSCDVNKIFLDFSTEWYHSVWRLKSAPGENLIPFRLFVETRGVIFEHKYYNSNYHSAKLKPMEANELSSWTTTPDQRNEMKCYHSCIPQVTAVIGRN